MSRDTPAATFEQAREAMKRGDLLEVFACVDPGGSAGAPDEEARQWYIKLVPGAPRRSV